MANDVTPTAEFQERMFNRIREQIGDLMSDEDLKKITTAAIDKAFFEPRKLVDTGGYSNRMVEAEPLFVELMRKELQPAFHKAIKEWLTENPAVVKEVLDEMLAKGMVSYLASFFKMQTQGPMMDLVAKLNQKGLLG